MSINWQELFPGRWSGFIFVSYMTLFINQGIIVTWSQSDGDYAYNTVTVVLLTEILKLIVSVVLYCWDNPPTLLVHEIIKHRHIFLLYMVPSVLYCLYNNLAFINLAVFDPTTYYLLLQFRVVVTGIIFQGNPQNVFDNVVPTILLQPKVIAIIINNAAIGIITSFFLKNLNSILKTFASALELVFTAILCWLLFNIPIYMNTVLAIAMVSYAVILYSQNPVQNVHPKIENVIKDEEEQLFLPSKHTQNTSHC
ncbi:hypothetical protein PV326_006170 [Microctonus aethiopoides]|nr:hypothetical protein PV326_006170 [Microctonus aethiopoides]